MTAVSKHVDLPEPPYLLSPWVRIDPSTGLPLEVAHLQHVLTGAGEIDLTAARNEYVSFQVIVPANWIGPKLNVSLSGMGKGSAITYRELEWFVQWSHVHDDVCYPDPLIPGKLTATALKAGLLKRIKQPKVVGLWIDVFVPRQARAGSYSGVLTVKSGRGQDAQLGVSLTVHRFAIDDECHMTADMNAYSGSYVNGWPEFQGDWDFLKKPRARKLLQSYSRVAHEHRSLIHSLNYSHSGYMSAGFAPELTGRGESLRVKSWSTFDKTWGPLFDGSAFRGTRRGEIPVPYSYTPFNFQWPASFIHYGNPGYYEMWRNIAKEFGDHAAERGWTRTKFEIFFNHKKRYKFFPWDGDETRFLADEVIFKEFYHEAVRDMVARKDMQFTYRTDSSWSIGVHSNDDEVSSIFNMWVINGSIGGRFPKGIANLRSKKQDVFFYGGLPGYNELFYSLSRWPLLSWMRDAQGFTPWLAVSGEKKPLAAGPAVKGRFSIFYPGHELGLDVPIVTMRSKIMRNTMQTMEYLYLLAKRDGGDRSKTWKIVNKALGTSRSDWWGKPEPFMKRPPHTWQNSDFSTAPRIGDWSHSDPRDFEKVRNAAAEALCDKKM
ncbi:MAG: hypothetical protein KAH23_09660 [Kiritimatiellae bacterium]|nr:hypothetical protein [Kiritimatiellia bacterium]